jgi:ABC-type bacteriocin/lantibiotic exporter with double-glycine peptidase domain
VLLQDSPAGCGVAAVCNALEALGDPQPQATVWKLAGASGTYGTQPRGVIGALRKLGHRTIVLQQEDPGQALVVLRGYLMHGLPVILLVQDSEHWVTAVGTLGDKVVIVDSADGGMTRCLDSDATIQRWRQLGCKKSFYGVAVTNRKWP